MDVWECDLVDVQAISRYNINNNTFLLTAINVFSKFLHIVPLRSKTGKDVTTAFRSIFKDPTYSGPVRRPIMVRTDKGKEFLNKTFQDMLKREGIELSVCRKPDVKCTVIDCTHRTLRDKLYKYFTYKNTHRYIDVLQDIVTDYNHTVHNATGMAPAHMSEKDVLAIWQRLNEKASRVRSVKAKYSVGQLVRISKEVTFANSAEQNYTTEIFRIIKVIHRNPRPVYELEDLN